jgi:hypothetical protein
MVALNYQTIDSFQILNLAMFEQNYNCGYVLKPAVLWDKQHPEYGRFNPFEKKKENEYTLLQLKIISGQYLTENTLTTNASTFTSNMGSNANSNQSNSGPTSIINNITTTSNLNGINSSNQHQHRNSDVEILQSTSTFVEIEILGIQCDCAKEKTKTFNKNALNPIWNEEFTFHVIIFFPDY